MISAKFCGAVRATLFVLFPLLLMPLAQSQGANKNVTATSSAGEDTDRDKDHEEERSAWFLHGRTVPGKSAAELRHRAYQAKMQARAARLARAQTPRSRLPTASSFADGRRWARCRWPPMQPASGFQNYNQVSGRATAVAIDPADPPATRSTSAERRAGCGSPPTPATSVANNVTWTAVTDDQATLSIGAIAIQPGNSDPAQSVVLVGTGEADNSARLLFRPRHSALRRRRQHLDVTSYREQRQLILSAAWAQPAWLSAQRRPAQ